MPRTDRPLSDLIDCLLIFLGLRSPDGLSTLPSDGISWAVEPAPRSIIAIGDIQGDFVALTSILADRNLIDSSGHWIGKTTHVVLIGDLIGGHRDSRFVLDFVMRISAEAETAGGAIHALLGNHDIAILSSRYRLRRAERKLFQNYAVPRQKGEEVSDLFRGKTPYAKWLRKRQALLKIGDSVFVHAGIHDWALHHSPDRVNATVRAWIRYWQGVGDKPGKATRWTVGKIGMGRRSDLAMGPLWIRAFKPTSGNKRPRGGPKNKTLAEVLDKWKARRLVLGHAPQRNGNVLLEHSYYGDKVVMIDTRISMKDRGRLSAVEISADEIEVHYSHRSDLGKRLREEALTRLEGMVQSPWQKFCHWIRGSR